MENILYVRDVDLSQDLSDKGLTIKELSDRIESDEDIMYSTKGVF